MNRKLIILSALVFTLNSCGLVRCTDSGYDDDYTYEYNDDEYDEEVSEPTTYVLCTACRGMGMVESPYTGEVICCPICEGDKVITRELAEQLEEAARIGTEAAEGIISDRGNNSPSYGGNYRSPSDIQREIQQCENEIASMEEGLEMTESSILQIEYRNRITELRYKIRQLENELNIVE